MLNRAAAGGQKKTAEVELRFYRFPGVLLAAEAQRCQVAGDVGSLLPGLNRARRQNALSNFKRAANLRHCRAGALANGELISAISANSSTHERRRMYDTMFGLLFLEL